MINELKNLIKNDPWLIISFSLFTFSIGLTVWFIVSTLTMI
jgi:hypothetical protein